MISSSSKQSTLTDLNNAGDENVQQMCQTSLPKKRSISESSVGKAATSSSKRPVNSNLSDRQRSVDQNFPDPIHLSHIASSNEDESASVIQLSSAELSNQSPTIDSLKAHSELIDLTCSDEEDTDNNQPIDPDLTEDLNTRDSEPDTTLQPQILPQRNSSCGQPRLLRSSCSSSSSSRPSCMVAANRNTTFAQPEIQHRAHGSQHYLRQSSFEETPHLSRDMDPLSSTHLPLATGVTRETIGQLNVPQAPTSTQPCHQPDCPHAMCSCHAHCPFCSVNTALNVAPPLAVQASPHYFVGCDLHSPCPGQCFHATHMQTMPTLMDPIATPTPNITLSSIPSCRNSSANSSRATPHMNMPDAHAAPPSGSVAPFGVVGPDPVSTSTTLNSQPSHYHHHHHHYQCIRTPVICPGVYTVPAQSFFPQTASPQPHHLVEVEVNVAAPMSSSLSTFYDHPQQQVPSSVVRHSTNVHLAPVDHAQNVAVGSIRADYPAQQAAPTPPLTQQRLLERQQDCMSRRREAQARWFDRQRSSHTMSHSSRYPPQYHPARGVSFRYAPDSNATPNTIAAVNVMLRHQQPHHHHPSAQTVAAAAAAAAAMVDPVFSAATVAAAAAATGAAAAPAAVYYSPYVSPLVTLGGLTPPAFQWAVAPQPETREEMYINSSIRHPMTANAEPFAPVVGVSYGANNADNVAMQAAMRLLQPPQVFPSSAVASVAAAVAATAASMPWRSPYVLVDRNAPMLNFEQHFLRHMAESMDLPQGASPTLIEQCTTKCNYKMPAEKPVAGEEEKCPVCLSEFENDEHVRYLPCNHWFHVDCIDRWLSTNKKCPVCRLHIDRDRQQHHHQQQHIAVSVAQS